MNTETNNSAFAEAPDAPTFSLELNPRKAQFIIAAMVSNAHYAKESRELAKTQGTPEDVANDQHIIDDSARAIQAVIDAAGEAHGPFAAMGLSVDAGGLWGDLVGEAPGYAEQEQAEVTTDAAAE